MSKPQRIDSLGRITEPLAEHLWARSWDQTSPVPEIDWNPKQSIIHASGNSKYSGLFQSLKSKSFPVYLKEDATLVVYSDGKNGPYLFEKQLIANNIPYLTAKIDKGSPHHPFLQKLFSLRDILSQVKTKWLLSLDAFDVILQGSLDPFIQEAERLRLNAFFGAERNHWPPHSKTKEIELSFHPKSPFQFLNAGVGLMQTDWIANKVKGVTKQIDDQEFFKDLYAKDYPKVDIDHEARFVLNLNGVKIKPKDISPVCLLKNPKVSFCTTCKGRTWQLKQTYIKNIEDNMGYPNVEFVLLNYQSPDDMDEWVKENLKTYIDKGIVKYYRLLDDYPWHMSVAKNMAHRLATGDILCNLDADNFLGKRLAQYLAERIGPDHAIRKSGGGSVGGFIAVYRSVFYRLGGYDEEFAAMGHQDNDFEARMMRSGINIVYLPRGDIPIFNTDEQRVQFGNGKSYRELCAISKEKREQNDQKGTIRVNHCGFTVGKVALNWSKNIVLQKDVNCDGEEYPRIAFIVPCMGRLKYLKESIGSVIAQPNIEYILIDWSCPDGCSDWAYKSVFNKNIRIIHKPNEMYFDFSKSRNIGAKYAEADYLCFVDCDMILEQSFCKVVRQNLKLNEDAFVAFCGPDEGGDGFSGTIVCKRSAFCAIGGYEEMLVGAGPEDKDLKRRLVSYGQKIVIIPKSLAKHIEHSNYSRTEYCLEKDLYRSRLQNHELLTRIRPSF